MKTLLQQYASYNIWATNRILVTAHALDESKLRLQVAGSFPSVYSSLLHLWDAESIWWQRLKLAERVEVPSQQFTGSFKELEEALLNQSELWAQWVKSASERQLSHVFAYQNNKREQFKQPVSQVLLHLFNHGTYHRGQVICMFYQLGLTEMPSTDFIKFSRKK